MLEIHTTIDMCQGPLLTQLALDIFLRFNVICIHLYTKQFWDSLIVCYEVIWQIDLFINSSSTSLLVAFLALDNNKSSVKFPWRFSLICAENNVLKAKYNKMKKKIILIAKEICSRKFFNWLDVPITFTNSAKWWHVKFDLSKKILRNHLMPA